jgi:cell wall-associated NlpC family hydrolase
VRVNEYVPLIPAAYGWNGAPPYHRADTPAGPDADLVGATRNRLAYEWLDYGELGSQRTSRANPPFLTGAAGRINGAINGAGAAKILRGYIRRANFDESELSKSRLYFMFNPETIVRDYVSYIDQAALDPFNTVFDSGNLVAPPSFMNFRFDLFFDRQDEVAQDIDHPGVYVDYQYFDMVVRNVIPSAPSQSTSQIADNGVMMVNPRDITVVFSPQLSVQGKPINAQVTFEKFSHRMTPVRMRISLEMRVVYIGPAKPQTEYQETVYEDDTASLVVPDDTADMTFNLFDVLSASNLQNVSSTVATGFTGLNQNITAQQNLTSPDNTSARANALQWAREHTLPTTQYDNGPLRGSGLDPSGYLQYVDCSGLVWNAYNALGLTQKMGWGGSVSNPSGTAVMLNSFETSNWKSCQLIFTWSSSQKSTAAAWFATNLSTLQPGDLLFRDVRKSTRTIGHVAFFVSTNGTSVTIFDASSKNSTPQVGERTISLNTLYEYTHVVRPVPFGSDGYASLTNQPGVWGYAFT